MKKTIINGRILTPSPMPDGYGILIEGERILAVAPSSEFPIDIPQIDAMGQWIVPGLIDIHVHGGVDNDAMDENANALNEMARFFASRGVTSFLPTTVAASTNDVTSAIERIANYSQTGDGARILGIHLEGPFLSYAHKGAQAEQHLRVAQPGEYLPWLESGFVKLFTVAPEIEGVLELIRIGVDAGVKFAVGHSNASYEQMVHAIDEGLTQATHTFNGMEPLHHRDPGVLGAVLTDKRVFAQVIADGVHLHPAVVNLLFITKGVEKTVLITDAIRATGAEDGRHQLGDQFIMVKNGIAHTDSGSLAGSTLTMDRALRNACKFTNCSFEAILPSATSIPAKSLGIGDKIGSIKPGLKADLVIFDEEIKPSLTMVAGKIVYQNKSNITT